MKVLLALVLCMFAFGCGDDETEETPDRATVIAGLTGNATTGETLYVACATCHGADGKGVDGVGNSLVDSTFTKDQIIEILLNGKPGTTMASYKTQTDQNLADLTAYTLAFQQQ